MPHTTERMDRQDRLDSNFLEILITKAMTLDKNYLVLISRVFREDYFDNTAVGKIFEFGGVKL